jgi:hypothetical protein
MSRLTGKIWKAGVRLRTLTVVFLLIGSGWPVSALPMDAAIARCRQTVGRPIVQNCMRAGGSFLACRANATPSVRACVRAASPNAMRGENLPPGMRGNAPGRMRTGCTRAKMMSGQPCL